MMSDDPVWDEIEKNWIWTDRDRAAIRLIAKHGGSQMTDNAESMPPNIREFNEIAAVIFAQLYVHFPLPKDIPPEEVARVVGASMDTKLPSGRTFNEVCSHTLVWLARQGYIESYAGEGGVPRSRVVLKDKAFFAMSLVPPALGRTLGSELVKVTGNPSSENKVKMAELVGTLVGSTLGSAGKAWSG
jgi:hypothetical protein